MGQIEMEKPGASGSILGGNQHAGVQLQHAAHPQDAVDLLMPGDKGVLQSN